MLVANGGRFPTTCRILHGERGRKVFSERFALSVRAEQPAGD